MCVNCVVSLLGFFHELVCCAVHWDRDVP